MKNIVVIDGQGGRLGKMLVEGIKEAKIDCYLLAIGTNSIATSEMLKAGANAGATGENPAKVACKKADIIVGPIGIVSADSLLGEITPEIALAVGQSDAPKLLLPVSNCNNRVVGVKNMTMAEMVAEAVNEIKSLSCGKC